jgi:addiction module RelB/DinJ family antitoxin
MSSVNVTIRMDEELKANLQNLVSDLGMDMTTFFTLAAKQAVRERALPFQPKMTSIYGEKAYELARKSSIYNEDGDAVIAKDDEWRNETEWDEIYEQIKKERGL